MIFNGVGGGAACDGGCGGGVHVSPCILGPRMSGGEQDEEYKRRFSL